MLNFTPGKGTPEISEFIQDEEIRSVDFKFCDLTGVWRHKTVPVESLCPGIFESGLGVDGSSTPKFATVNHGDIVIVPDLSTGFIDPAFDRPCLSLLCDVVSVDDRAPHPFDPRGLAKRAMSYMRSNSVIDDILFLPELEFYLFEEVDYHSGEDEAYWRIVSSEGSFGAQTGAECDCERGSAPRGRIRSEKGYMVVPPLDAFTNIRDLITEQLIDIGIDVKYHHHEVGSFGQQEIEFKLKGLLDTADSVLTGKYITRLIAVEYGLNATFMPKPFPNKAGNGLHYHILVRKNGKSVSYDPAGYGKLSKTALSFIAGILHHGRALMALTSASTNSYRRLKPGFETPTSFYFSAANREAAIRIPLYVRNPEEIRWEFRPSDATGNPYLSLSAMLLAGLDGIERGLDPSKEGFGPFDGAGPKLKRTSRNLGRLLPVDLTEALHALDSDHDFLLKGDVFSEELIRTYISYKYENEIFPLQNRPHPFEFEMYFNI